MVNRPIRKFRSANFEIAIWHNEREDRDGNLLGFKTLSVTRSWKKKGEDVWRSDVLNIRRQDIPKLLVLLNKANEELLIEKEVE